MQPWRDDQPIYKQIQDRVVASILDGDLKEGEPVPSVRNVAVDMQVNPLTVSKAYQDLLDDGVVERRRGLGMFVIEGARQRLLDAARKRFLAEEWPEIAARIKRLGLTPADLLSSLNQDDTK
jgi:GntR family transcriptional regulator